MQKSDKLSAVLLAILAYAREVPGLMEFLNDNRETALRLVKRLAEVYRGMPFDEWKREAKDELVRLGVRGKEEWQEMLLNLAHEVLKAEAAKPWWKKAFGWFSKAKDWLTRWGLNTFVEDYARDVIYFVRQQVHQPGITFEGLYRATFEYVKSISPNSADTWKAFLVNLGLAVVRARTGVSF